VSKIIEHSNEGNLYDQTDTLRKDRLEFFVT